MLFPQPEPALLAPLLPELLLALPGRVLCHPQVADDRGAEAMARVTLEVPVAHDLGGDVRHQRVEAGEQQGQLAALLGIPPMKKLFLCVNLKMELKPPYLTTSSIFAVTNWKTGMASLNFRTSSSSAPSSLLQPPSASEDTEETDTEHLPSPVKCTKFILVSGEANILQ